MGARVGRAGRGGGTGFAGVMEAGLAVAVGRKEEAGAAACGEGLDDVDVALAGREVEACRAFAAGRELREQLLVVEGGQEELDDLDDGWAGEGRAEAGFGMWGWAGWGVGGVRDVKGRFDGCMA